MEDFWGILKQAVYSGGWEAENHDQLKRRILYRLHRINKTMLYNMRKNLKSKLRQARDNGVNYLLHWGLFAFIVRYKMCFHLVHENKSSCPFVNLENEMVQIFSEHPL